MENTIHVEKDRKKGKKERRKHGNIHIWEQNERNEKETYDHPYILTSREMLPLHKTVF
jgi:hypothetical protein